MCCAGVQEARLLSSLRHPNIVTFMGLCTHPACIITEFCSRGSVTDVIRRGKAAPATLPWTRRLDMVSPFVCVFWDRKLAGETGWGTNPILTLPSNAGHRRRQGHAVSPRRHPCHGSQVCGVGVRGVRRLQHAD